MSQKKRQLTIFLIVFIDLLGFGLILPLLPYVAENYNATPLIIGLLSASYSLFQFISGPILGNLSDRYGRKKILLISQAGSLLGYLILAFANSLPLLFISRIIDGITGGNISIAQAYMADITDKKTRAKGMGLLGAAFGLGFMLGPALGGYLSQQGFIYPALTAALISLVTLIMTSIYLQETVAKNPSSTKKNLLIDLSQLRLVFAKAPLNLYVITFFFLSLGFSGMQGTYALWTQDTFDWGPSNVGAIFTFIGILSILAQTQILPRSITRYGEKRLLLSSIPILSLGFLTLTLSSNLSLHLFAITLIVIGNSLANPTLTALATEAISQDSYGETLGIFQSFGTIGRIIGPVAAGELFLVLGKNAPFVASSLIFILTWLFLLKKTAKKVTL